MQVLVCRMPSDPASAAAVFFLLDVFMQKLQFNFTKGSSKCLRTFVESKVKFNFLEM